jgi:hypothetical protein
MSADANPAGGADAGSPQLHDVAVLVSMSDSGDASAAILTLKADGTLVDPGARVDLPKNARALAIRPDGREAMLVYGTGASADKGARIVTIGEGFASAEVAQTLTIESQHSATSAMYTDDASAAIAMRGPSNDYVLSLDRDVQWSAGAEVECGAGPLALHKTDDPDELLLLRTDFGGNFDSAALPVQRRNDGGWEASAAAYDFAPFTINDLAVGGHFAFVPTEDPDTASELNPKGRIQTLARQESGEWTQTESVLLTDDAAQIALSREGKVLVLNDAVKSLDPTGTVPILERHDILTVAVANDGSLQPLEGERTPLGKDLIRGMDFGPGETLVVAQTTDLGHQVRSFRRASAEDSTWQEVSSVTLEASPTGMAISE